MHEQLNFDDSVLRVLPLEGGLHLPLLLVNLLDLEGDPGKEFFKVGEEMRLISPQLSPQAPHLTRSKEAREGEEEETGGQDEWK